MSNLKIYCVTNKRLDLLESYSYKFGWVGKDKVPENYIRCDDKENIFMRATRNFVFQAGQPDHVKAAYEEALGIKMDDRF